MLSLFYFLIVMFKADARDQDYDPVEITFKINYVQLNTNLGYMFCDHAQVDMFKNKYTVREGEEFTIITKYDSDISHVICREFGKDTHLNFHMTNNETHLSFTQITYMAVKRMGTLWKCTILAHETHSRVLPVVQHKDTNYSAAYCFMQIHVRQKFASQTIVVDNMVVPAVRTDLSENDVDFTAEYRYVNGDEINVACVNYCNLAPLTMEYAMAGTMSDKSILKEASFITIGFFVKMHSGHNNSYMICTHKEPTDYTKVMVRFVMRKELNTVSVRINGVTLRPNLKNQLKNHYEIEYKYLSHQLITVECEVQRTYMNLEVLDTEYVAGKVKSYKKTELIPFNKAEMRFKLNPEDEKQLTCRSVYGGNEEKVEIRFTAGNSYKKPYPLHMELPSNGTVMTLYDAKVEVIYYEFNDGETLQLKCGPLVLPTGPGPVRYLQLDYTDTCSIHGCFVSETLHVTRKHQDTEIACYLKERRHEKYFTEDILLREVRVILRERGLSIASTTTTTSSPVTALTTIVTTTDTAADTTSSQSSINTLGYCLSAVGSAVLIMLVIILYLLVKNRYCCIKSSSQDLPSVPPPRPHPDTVFYENLLSVFRPIIEREAAQLDMENHYEVIE